jgi:lipopolysaccharide biosynthesis glycosyltransferase
MDSVHTFGTYYRLFVNDILPSDVRHVIYLDTDVIFLANLAELWRHVDDRLLFQWGSECAGVLLLNVHRFGEFWGILKRSNWTGVELPHADQSILNKVMQDYPDKVGNFSKEWDLNVASHWRYRGDNSLLKNRPELGLVHYNGGGSTKEAFFTSKNNAFVYEFTEWGVAANYYANLPWSWLRFLGRSVSGADKGGRITIEGIMPPPHHNPPK